MKTIKNIISFLAPAKNQNQQLIDNMNALKNNPDFMRLQHNLEITKLTQEIDRMTSQVIDLKEQLKCKKK